ncbi:DNA recombination protein RmuC [Acidovorax sp. sif1233]|uniref:DNA recombination protein RmuC n=1 Tax=unclassified Acidovorax TaxID=2684926 RepID=UPI001C478912|nr:DNA recombination protein RmuC [Acidovorax sp. sif1233]MBV7457396.1 DNA recombination protein RmuC [Acidovorax sp. sif1233]
MTTDTLILLAALALVLVLLVLLMLRRPRVDLPPEWLARLQALEHTAQATQIAVAKNDGALDGMGQQLRGFTHTTQATLETLRHAVDERLAQAVAESRNGRAELLAAFGVFEGRLEQRQAAQDAALAQRFDALQNAVAGRLEESSKALLAHLAQGQADAATARTELSATLVGFRTELTATTAALAAESVKSREAMGESAALFEKRIQERFEALQAATRLTLDSLKGDIQTQLGTMSSALKDQLEANGFQIRNQFSVLQDAVSQQLTGLVQGSQQNAEQLRNALNERLAAIQADNSTKLEEMRRTVDEKLHATLEQRLGESFKLVSDRLEQVHKGLGEMQTLAGSVGDLKRVMTNVKSRGTWGEMQLGAIIDNVLTPDQFARNVKTVPGSDELVEFAIRLPGKSDEHPVWLPIDSKYPVEQYQRLMDAQDAADKGLIASAGNAFEASIKLEAKKIFAKYVSPPHTTDFAVLYLPTEGLFAEVIRRPGLVEAIQNDCRVMITGPANLAAMLNSLQMGFKTLAIEKRSSEVWSLLGMVKTEFAKFGDVVEATKKSIDAAAKRFDEVGVRTRAIQRKLRDVQDLPAPPGATLPLPVGGGTAALPGLDAEDDPL